MEKVIEFYTKVLSFAGLKVDENGKVYSDSIGQKIPILMDEKEIILPLDSQLRSPNIGSKIIFHPVPEALARGESPILAKLSHIMNVNLNMKSYLVFNSLLHIMNSPEMHKLLSAEQIEALVEIGSIDKTGFTTISSLLRKGMKVQSNRLFTHIFLKKGGKVESTRYNVAGIVSFPLKEMILRKENPFDTKLRDKDRELIIKLYDYIFPCEKDKDCYSRGSHSDYIRYLDALLSSAMSLAVKLNMVTELFEDKIEELEDATIDLSVFDMMGHIDDIIDQAKRLPMQPGNVADVRQTAEVKPEESKFISPSQLIHRNAPVHPQPTYPPMYGQVPIQAPQPSVGKDGSIDWKSVVQSNPMLAAQAGQFMGANATTMYSPPQERQPAWLAKYSNPLGQQQQPIYGGYQQPQQFQQPMFSNSGF